jgi:transposase-like protein
MITELKTPKTLMEAIKYFADPDVALHYMSRIVWPNGPACPHCKSQHVSFISTRRIWKCNACPGRKQFSIKVGTIMEDSPLSIDKWLMGIWMEANCKNSISSYEVARDLGITQKSAWFMLHRIRFAVKNRTFMKMGGPGRIVEADETMIGGLAANMHKAQREAKVGKSRGGAHMTNVMGLLERHGEKKHSTIRTKVLPDRTKGSLHAVIHENVKPGTALYTDALKNYRDPAIAAAFQHEFIDHAETYVRGAVHTNGLENFWALFKRCIKGTHVSVEPFHLEAYVDSEAFRFNNRKTDDSSRFIGVLQNVSGKRLDYQTLIGKNDSVPLS